MHLTGPWRYEAYDAPIRSMSDITESIIDELTTKIWYDRHMVSRERGCSARIEKLVPKLPDVPWPKRKNLIQQDVWGRARESAAVKPRSNSGRGEPRPVFEI